MVVALACIVGLIFGVVFVLKRFLPGTVRSQGERFSLHVLAQLSLGSRQRVAVIRVQERTLVIGITEGSINTLTELTTPQSDAQKEADDPKIFADLLSWRKNGPAAAPREQRKDSLLAEPVSSVRKPDAPKDDRGDGPFLFPPGGRAAR